MTRLCEDIYEEWAHDGLALAYGERITCTKTPHPENEGHYNDDRQFGWLTYPAAVGTEVQE
jgi:hypothetical protein